MASLPCQSQKSSTATSALCFAGTERASHLLGAFLRSHDSNAACGRACVDCRRHSVWHEAAEHGRLTVLKTRRAGALQSDFPAQVAPRADGFAMCAALYACWFCPAGRLGPTFGTLQLPIRAVLGHLTCDILVFTRRNFPLASRRRTASLGIARPVLICDASLSHDRNVHDNPGVHWRETASRRETRDVDIVCTEVIGQRPTATCCSDDAEAETGNNARPINRDSANS